MPPATNPTGAKGQGPRLEASLRHGGVAAVANAALGTYAAGALADITGWQPLHAGITAAVATAGVAAATSMESMPAGVRAYLTAATAAAGGWITYAAATSPWPWEQPAAGTALLAGAAGLGALYPVVRRRLQRWRGSAVSRPGPATVREVRSAGGWELVLARAGLQGVEVLRRAEQRYGYTLMLRLPDSGKITISTIRLAAERLAVAADLGNGWLLEVEPGPSARTVLLHALSPDALVKEYMLPDTTVEGPTSINDPFAAGIRADGRACMVLFREVAGLIVGVRGSGKTNLLNVFLAKLTQTMDAVVWYIDVGKQGKAARPWLSPWLQGRTGRPVLDWVATTTPEAERMLRAYNAAIKARARMLTGAEGDDAEKITPSPSLPAIILVIDEAPSIFGEEDFRTTISKRASGEEAANADLVRLATDGVRTGRSEAVDMLLASQRVTNSMVGGGDLKSQLELRIGLHAPNGMDLSMVFPDHRVDARKLIARGCMYIAQDGAPVVAKGYRLPYGRIPSIAEAHTAWRPAVDAATAAEMGADYAYRWDPDRAGHLLPAQLTTTVRSQLPTAGSSVSGPRGGGLADLLGDGPDLTPSWRTGAGAPLGPGARRPTARGGRPDSQDQDGGRDPELAARFRAVVAGLPPGGGPDGGPGVPALPTPVAAGPRLPEALVQAVAAFERAGVERLHTESLLEVLGVPELTARRLGDLLGEVGVSPLPNAFVVEGVTRRGYAAADIHAAVADITQGRRTPPTGAFWWPTTTR